MDRFFGLSVKYYDQETGFHYNCFRDYNPTIGRYIQTTPVGLKGGALGVVSAASGIVGMFALGFQAGAYFVCKYKCW